MVTRKTAGDNDRVCIGGLDAEMGGLITWRCDCDDCDGGRDNGISEVEVDVECTCNRQDSM